MNRYNNNAVQKTSATSAAAASNARSTLSAKPSQWICKQCGFTNLAANSKCACGAFKSGGSYAAKNSGGAVGTNSCKGGICQISDK